LYSLPTFFNTICGKSKSERFIVVKLHKNKGILATSLKNNPFFPFQEVEKNTLRTWKNPQEFDIMVLV